MLRVYSQAEKYWRKILHFKCNRLQESDPRELGLTSLSRSKNVPISDGTHGDDAVAPFPACE